MGSEGFDGAVIESWYGVCCLLGCVCSGMQVAVPDIWGIDSQAALCWETSQMTPMASTSLWPFGFLLQGSWALHCVRTVLVVIHILLGLTSSTIIV